MVIIAKGLQFVIAGNQINLPRNHEINFAVNIITMNITIKHYVQLGNS